MQTYNMTYLEQTMLNRYRLLQRLGRGSMGEVWEAEDTELARHVAIKLLSPVLRQEEDYLHAFANEARQASQLDHPHILPVHDFGEVNVNEDVITYLVYPLVTSGSLRDLIQRYTRPLPAALSLHYLRQAAEAIDFAHSQGLIHRAIKPSNMLLQDHWLFLTDFSLARLLTTTTYRSRTYAGTGTPEYMAPEQIQGQTRPASDRYSLAVIAYQLLTGQAPFQDQNPYDVFLQHICQQPPVPRQHNQHIPQEVEPILLRALAKDPEERYSTCMAFIEALEEQYQSAGISLHDPARSAGITTNNLSSNQTPTEQGLQSSPLTHPSHAWKLPRRSFLITGGATALLLAGGGAALIALKNMRKRIGPQQFMPGRPVLKLTRHTAAVTGLHWRPQGRYLASTSLDTRIAIWDIDTALMQSISNPTMLKSWKFVNAIDGNNFNWSPDGQTLAISEGANMGQDKQLPGFINILPVVHTQQSEISYSDQHQIYSDQRFISLAWSPDQTWLAATTQSEATALWRTGKTQAIDTILHSTNTTSDANLSLLMLAWSADAAWLAGWRRDFKLILWQPAHSNKPSAIIDLPSRPSDTNVYGLVNFNGLSLPQVSLHWSPATGPDSGNLLAIADREIIAIFDRRSNKITHLLGVDDPLLKLQQSVNGTTYAAQITALSWSSNGRYLAGSYLTSKKIFIWDLQNSHPHSKSGHLLPDFTFGQTEGHSQNILSLDWSPDGRYLASASLDHTIIIWQVDRAS